MSFQSFSNNSADERSSSASSSNAVTVVNNGQQGESGSDDEDDDDHPAAVIPPKPALIPGSTEYLLEISRLTGVAKGMMNKNYLRHLPVALKKNGSQVVPVAPTIIPPQRKKVATLAKKTKKPDEPVPLPPPPVISMLMQEEEPLEVVGTPPPAGPEDDKMQVVQEEKEVVQKPFTVATPPTPTDTVASRFTRRHLPVPTAVNTMEKDIALIGMAMVMQEQVGSILVSSVRPPGAGAPANQAMGQSMAPQLLARTKAHKDLAAAMRLQQDLMGEAQAYVDGILSGQTS